MCSFTGVTCEDRMCFHQNTHILSSHYLFLYVFSKVKCTLNAGLEAGMGKVGTGTGGKLAYVGKDKKKDKKKGGGRKK